MKYVHKKIVKSIESKLSIETTVASIIAYSIYFIIITLIFFIWGELKKLNYYDPINASKFGQFGDFVGGILGTIFSILAFYLLYKTYSLQRKQSGVQIIDRLYLELVDDIANIEYKKKEEIYNEVDKKWEIKETKYSGIEALYEFDKNHWHSPNSVMNHLCSICVSFENLVKLINVEESDFKEIMLTKTYFLFHKKIIWPVYQNIYDKLLDDQNPKIKVRWNGKEDEIKPLRDHTDNEIFITKYEQLTKDTYAHLLHQSRKYVNEPKERKMRRIIGLNPVI